MLVFVCFSVPLQCESDKFRFLVLIPNSFFTSIINLKTSIIMAKIAKEFKEFAMRGNVVDMAVGVIVGGAFGKIVSSVVDDLIMPLVGKLLGGANFKDLFCTLDGFDATGQSLAAVREAGHPVFAYGNFIQTIVDFLIIAFCIFLMIKGINKLKKKEEAAPEAPAEPSNEEKLLTEIRDLLKDKK